jgi:RimJ/RimL family protein N-acetyltransferase
MIELRALNRSDMPQIAKWRNEQRAHLRTSFLMTDEMQYRFYDEVISNRNANARYFGIYEVHESGYDFVREVRLCKDYKLIGMCGIENIQWENRLGEISLIFRDGETHDKYGKEVLSMILKEAFGTLNLQNVFTEVYDCSPFTTWWEIITDKCDLSIYALPERKFFNGEYFCSMYINFFRGKLDDYIIALE